MGFIMTDKDLLTIEGIDMELERIKTKRYKTQEEFLSHYWLTLRVLEAILGTKTIIKTARGGVPQYKIIIEHLISNVKLPSND